MKQSFAEWLTDNADHTGKLIDTSILIPVEKTKKTIATAPKVPASQATTYPELWKFAHKRTDLQRLRRSTSYGTLRCNHCGDWFNREDQASAYGVPLDDIPVLGEMFSCHDCIDLYKYAITSPQQYPAYNHYANAKRIHQDERDVDKAGTSVTTCRACGISHTRHNWACTESLIVQSIPREPEATYICLDCRKPII